LVRASFSLYPSALISRDRFFDNPNTVLAQLESALPEAGIDRATFRKELASLGDEKNPEVLWREIYLLGLRFKESRSFAPALAVFKAVSRHAGDAELRLEAAEELKSVSGEIFGGKRWEFLLASFLQQATDHRLILPYLAGAVAYQIFRAGSLFQLSPLLNAGGTVNGLAARSLAGAIGLAAETGVISGTGHFLNDNSEAEPSHQIPNLILELGLMKAFGFVASHLRPLDAKSLAGRMWNQPFLPIATSLLALVVARSFEGLLGLRQDDGKTHLIEILATGIGMGVSGHLAQRLLHPVLRGLPREPSPAQSAQNNSPFDWMKTINPIAELATAVPVRSNHLPNISSPQPPHPLLMTAKANSGSRRKGDVKLKQLLKQHRENPEDLRMLEVLADHLMEKGHSQGELISLAIKILETNGREKDALIAVLLKNRHAFELRLKDQLNAARRDPDQDVYGTAYGIQELFWNTRYLFGADITIDPNLLADILQSDAGLFLSSLKLFRRFPETGDWRQDERGIRFQKREFAEFFASPYLEKIDKLVIDAVLWDEEVKILANSPQLKNLRILEIIGSDIGDGGVAAIANSPHLENLVSLNLNDNDIGIAGARALLNSPYLNQLTDLNLQNAFIEDEAIIRRLRKRFKNLTVDLL